MHLNVFLFGTLLDDGLRETVAGCALNGAEAVLPGYGSVQAEGGAGAVLGQGRGIHGILLRAVPETVLDRLRFYAEGVGNRALTVSVQQADAEHPALIFQAGSGATAVEKPWNLPEWQRAWGAMTRRAAREAMDMYGHADGAVVCAAMPMIRLRAASVERAILTPSPVVQRAGFGREDVTLIKRTRPYVDYFAVDDLTLHYRRFDGTQSETIQRAGFLSGDAAIVLPYDPVRDRVLLVEQFRVGPYLRGDPHPWSLEPVAGRIDPGETPEIAARRESIEEAGLSLQRLVPLPSHYSSPGAISEYFWPFIALCDLPDLSAGTGGLDEEDEDIRTHVLSFDALMEAVANGEAENGPLLLMALWLERERARGSFA